MFKNNKKTILLFNIFMILGLLWLPYYLFDGKLFIGGDDTRLFYIFPENYVQNLSFYSWYNFSSVGSYNPNQFLLPLLFIVSLVKLFIHSQVVVDYLFFSSPIILGFIFFQKLVKELMQKKHYSIEIVIGSLFYVLSPILIYNQYSIFLYAVWLVPLLPITTYYLTKYLRTGNAQYILKNVLFGLPMSLAVYSIPWLLGFVIPIFFGTCFGLFLINRSTLKLLTKRSVIFFSVFILTQSFWLFPFAMTFLQNSQSNYGAQVLSVNTANSFANTVLSTASGNILFPLLNLFHRQIAIDYHWGLGTIFNSFYDFTFMYNVIFLIIIFLSLISMKNNSHNKITKLYAFILIVFVISLFLFTINIGPFKYLFINLHFLPGIAMFRNFYDKFALGYSLIFSVLFTISLVQVNKSFLKMKYIFNSIIFLVILINVIPIKQTIVRPLWETKNISLNISFPEEYLNFMKSIKSNVPAESNIISLPFNIASYTFIKDVNSNNIFAGTSPVKILTGINDYAGNLSFSGAEAAEISNYIIKKDYNSLLQFFSKYNINYIFITKNIPKEVLHSYLFNNKVLSSLDSTFIQKISNKKLVSSKDGNYELYSIKKDNVNDITKQYTFQKINQVYSIITFHNINKDQKFRFIDSYHPGWELYPISESNNVKKGTLFLFDEFKFILQRPFPNSEHKQFKNFGNEWIIHYADVKGSKFAKLNKDGTFDLTLALYFKPQLAFYFGSIISVVTLVILCFFIVRKINYVKN